MQTETHNIHGHDVLDLIASAEPALTLDALIDEVDRRWGANALFCTCAQQNMSFNELMHFLISRGKVACSDGALVINHANVCSDSHTK